MIEEDINKIEEKVEKQSFAMELLQFSKEQNKQLEGANKRLIVLLIVITSMWFITIGGFLYYVFTVDYVDTEETAEVENESATDFFKMLKSEANSQEEMQLVKEYAQRIAQM